MSISNHQRFLAEAKGTSLEFHSHKISTAIIKTAEAESVEPDLLFAVIFQMAWRGVVSQQQMTQLVEYIPESVRLAAQAMKTSECEFLALVQDGSVWAHDFLPKFADVLIEKLVGDWHSRQACCNCRYFVGSQYLRCAVVPEGPGVGSAAINQCREFEAPREGEKRQPTQPRAALGIHFDRNTAVPHGAGFYALDHDVEIHTFDSPRSTVIEVSSLWGFCGNLCPAHQMLERILARQERIEEAVVYLNSFDVQINGLAIPGLYSIAQECSFDGRPSLVISWRPIFEDGDWLPIERSLEIRPSDNLTFIRRSND